MMSMAMTPTEEFTCPKHAWFRDPRECPYCRIEELEAELRFVVGIAVAEDGDLNADQLNYLMDAKAALLEKE